MQEFKAGEIMSVESIAEDLGLILPKEVLFEYWCLARGIAVPFRLRAQIASSRSLHYWRGIRRSALSRSLCDTLPAGAYMGTLQVREYPHLGLHIAYHLL